MVITKIQVNKKNKHRVSVFVEGDVFAFACSLETLENERLGVGDELRDEDVERIEQADGRQYAWNYATAYLRRGLHSEKQVRDKLLEREVDPDAIDDIMQQLRDLRLVDDEEYARLYAAEQYKKYGRWEVIRRLRAKGIADSIIDTVASEPGNAETLEKYIERLWNRCSDDPPERRFQKMMRSLSARGFDFDQIREAVKDYERARLEKEADDACGT